MTAFDAISAGIRAAWRNKTLVSLFFACNLLLAAAIAAPVYSAISDHVGHSMVANDLARGFSAPWLTEFQLAYAHFLKGFSIAIVYGGILFLLLNCVLSAGAFEVFRNHLSPGREVERKNSTVESIGGSQTANSHFSISTFHFFGLGIGRFWGRFLRITAGASIFYFLLFWLWADRFERFNRFLWRNSVREAPHFYLDWLRWALLFFCCFVVSATVDYLRAVLVLNPEESILPALGQASGFLLANFGRVMTIYFGAGILSAIAVLAYAAFARFFPQSSAVTVFVWFVVAQALLWVRWLLRLSSWAAAVAYYRHHEFEHPVMAAGTPQTAAG